MTLREILNVTPDDSITQIELMWYDHKENVHSYRFSFRIKAEDVFEKWSNIMLEHFADDEVMEISNGIWGITIVVDRLVSNDAVKRWKTEAAEAVGLSWILRDWED